LFSVEHTNPFLPSIGTRLQDYGVVIHRVWVTFQEVRRLFLSTFQFDN
jgi:hypothetical protein